MENNDEELTTIEQQDNTELTSVLGHESEPSTPDLPPIDEPDLETMCAALDGVLLLQNKPISFEKLAPILGTTPARAEQVVLLRKQDYDNDPKSGLQIAIMDTGIQFATKAKVSQFIQRMDGQKLVSLSLPALETLSVIAFKQPITKAEIDAVRGVDCAGVVSSLLEKKLIYVSGEKQVIGHPRLYSTTQDFLFYFGINSLKELPVPSLDIPEELTPEGQAKESQEDKAAMEQVFNESQGFTSVDNNEDNLSGEDIENIQNQEQQLD